ncbi:calcium-binding protein [Cribrihabitans pelagius]|uniref:calcium-binding protein n=1 Tax=Cribrihabitans pelagius TaxID=1765746 RepID=UPI003B5CA9F4
MANKITLTADYGYSQYRYNGGTADAIDATDATWIVANQGSKTNNYPFLVDDAKTGIDVYGAAFNGQVSLTGEWAKTYSNSAAFMVRDTEKADVSDLRISRAWDAVRFGSDSDGFEVSDVWASEIRDDVFENDHANSGTISNSLFDGVFSGLSMTHQVMPKLTSKVVTLDNVLMRMESYAFENGKTHGSPFKIEANSPSLSVHNSVLAIEDVNHIGQGRLEQAWDKMVSSSGNVFLNLSDNPLPKGYPMPGKGWTVLQGQEARDYWDAARDEWIANRGEEPAADTAGPVQPAQDLEDQAPAAGTAPADEPAIPAADSSGPLTLNGTNGDDQLTGGNGNDALRGKQGSDELRGGGGNDAMYGGAGNDKLSGGNGRDMLSGKRGNDELTGGAGEDIFIFDTAPNDSKNVDTITDFKPGADKIALDTSVFTGLKSGADTLDAAGFTMAGRADDGEDRLIYTWKTGALHYDADGSGRGAQVQIAQLESQLDLGASDFLLI